MDAEDLDRSAVRESAGQRLTLIVRSFARLSGMPLVDAAPGELERAMWHAPRAIVAHGTEAVPLFFYANRIALDLFEIDAANFIGMPSHLSAEPTRRGERERMLARLAKSDMIDHYSGVRIAASGRRFTIENARVWNLVDEQRVRHGQAASFAEWRFLDPA